MINVELLSAQDRADLIEIETHLRLRPARENFVRDLLNPDEYQQVKSRFEAGEHITSIWMTLRGVTQAQSYAELGRRLLSLRDDRANSLLLACGESPPPPIPKADSKPRWDQDSRILTMDGIVCRSFRRPAENATTILDTFERDGWRARVDDPFGGDSVKRHQAIKSLNTGCEHIKFSGADSGIVWERLVAEVTSARSPRMLPKSGRKARTKRKPK